MNNQINQVQELKEVLKKGMIQNFKQDGFLTPMFFIYKDGKAMFGEITDGLIDNPEGRNYFASYLKSLCRESNVLAAGIITEARTASFPVNSEMTLLIESRNVNVSELKETQDIIMMLFSTTDTEEIFSYEVDCSNKTIGEKIQSEGMESFSGLFSGLFSKAA